jgi:hypothetical protein
MAPPAHREGDISIWFGGGHYDLALTEGEPTDPVERANWLPAPKGRFYLVTRHYSPKSPILTGDWLPPPVTKR